MKFKSFTSSRRKISEGFLDLTDQQKLNEVSTLCKLSTSSFANIIDEMPMDVRSGIDAYITNPLYLIEASVFDQTNLTIPRRRDKYVPIFIDLLNDNSGVLKIHPLFVQRYGRDSIATDSITNKRQILDFLHKSQPGPSTTWPTINTKDGSSVKIYHLLKTGQFRIAKDTSSDTDIKEGLVSVLFVCLQKGYLTKTVTFNKNNLPTQIQKISKALHAATGESATSLKKIDGWLQIQSKAPSKQAADILHQTFVQAKVIHNEYPKAKLDRGFIFNAVRELGAAITMFPKDKWNPGDIYIVLPGAAAKFAQAQKEIAASTDPAKRLQILNDLFVHNWGDADRSLVSVSLKLAEAQGGKAKDFLKKFSSQPSDYNITSSDEALTKDEYIRAIMYMRKWLKNACDSFSGASIIYNGSINVSDGLSGNEKRLKEKYACLKQYVFLLQKGGIDNMDNTIVSVIGFALSLAGVNPTFFKITAAKDSESTPIPQKFTAGGAVTLHPVENSRESIIYIDDKETASSIYTRCKIEKGENICDVTLESRVNGYKQATIEITRIHCRHTD